MSHSPNMKFPSTAHLNKKTKELLFSVIKSINCKILITAIVQQLWPMEVVCYAIDNLQNHGNFLQTMSINQLLNLFHVKIAQEVLLVDWFVVCIDNQIIEAQPVSEYLSLCNNLNIKIKIYMLSIGHLIVAVDVFTDVMSIRYV